MGQPSLAEPFSISPLCPQTCPMRVMVPGNRNWPTRTWFGVSRPILASSPGLLLGQGLVEGGGEGGLVTPPAFPFCVEVNFS